MVSKQSKFLLCENPIHEDGDSLYILHTREPRLFAEVHHFDAGDEAGQMALKKQQSIYGALEYGEEYIIFVCLWVIGDMKYIGKTAQEQADELAGIMRRMADWYKAYLIWEDQQLWT